MASFEQRWDDNRWQHTCLCKQDSVLFSSGYRCSGQLHSSREGSGRFLQVLRRICGQGPSTGTHDCVRRFVDVANPEATTCKTIGQSIAASDSSSDAVLKTTVETRYFANCGAGPAFYVNNRVAPPPMEFSEP